MRSKTSCVEKSNRLLDQPSTNPVTGDYIGNNLNITGDRVLSGESSREDNYSQNITNEENNDSSNTIIHMGEDSIKNLMLFLGFVGKFLELVVVSALVILAIKWQLLHDFIQEHFNKLIISLLGLLLISASLMLVKFRGRFWFVYIIVNILFLTNLFWCLAADSFDSLVFSPYCVVLCVATQMATWLFLSVLTYFHKATHKGCGIYGYAIIVPLMFLMLSQPYFIWAYLKSANGTMPEDTFKTCKNTVEDHDFIMSYQTYMINVGSAIGFATVTTLEMVAWLQRTVKGLKFKSATGILSGSNTALADDEDVEAANVPPVHL